MRQIRKARETLHAVELNHGDGLIFQRADGTTVEVKLIDTGAEVMETDLAEVGVEEPAARTTLRFFAEIEVAGEPHRLAREIGTQASFHEPRAIAGLHIWLDAVDVIFQFLHETHGPCRSNVTARASGPDHFQARFVVQDASLRICPDRLHPWCPLPQDGLKIADCYRGEDCWLGAYHGASAHGGLDINHAPGTPLWAPLDFDDQHYFNSLELGHRNNRWMGLRRWTDGSEWILRAHHMRKPLVPEHAPLARGTHYAEGAGVLSGAVDHSHFSFEVYDRGVLYRLDPWILFQQMYRDAEEDPAWAARTLYERTEPPVSRLRS